MLELVRLLDHGQPLEAAVVMAVCVLGGLAMVQLGYGLARSRPD